MKYDFGFIGAGCMGSALCRAVAKNLQGYTLAVCDADSEKVKAVAAETGAAAVTAEEIAGEAEFIFLGVKPQALTSLSEQISDILKARSDRYTVVSMAAGTAIERIETLFSSHGPVIRIMPNLACSVGAGMVLVSKNELVTDSEMTKFSAAMKSSGALDEIPESLMDAGCALSGSGPAFVFMMIEALADGGVDCGLPGDKAYRLAAQTLLGSAELMLESGKAPAVLKDNVCSPGGTTIEGVRTLEKGGFRSSVMEAVRAAYNRAKNM